MIVHNNWSGGDQLKNISTLYTTANITVSASTDFQVNGDYSWKVYSNYTGYNHIIFYEASLAGTVQGKITVLNNNPSNAFLRIQEIETNQYNDIKIPPNESMMKISISRELSYRQNTRFALIVRNPATIYVDEISLTLQ